ncbi:formylglycine-generating enzyme family protein [Streptomyces sp. ISL-94]|uniref:formylglycine-generating enzyme family protein n=1 Tax=Streptomyces sp. ISL-94 TaxID=2819190 RepID=UPI001BE87CEF|nr:SUMF1/EgtB/PvdO family nonheme iron enzyme [Streptomyces sp. ISL-94]MBT2480129.1 SUMF1/EgtB/PvdO family nonheme iron enzyme [Streptomyces sp. ISL-94]
MKLADVADSPHFREHAALARTADVRASAPAARRLAALGPAALAALVEDPAAPLAERLAAGGILALTGDPRIDTLRPAVCAVPGGTVEIGLAPERVGATVEAWEHVGVVRSWIDKETPAHTVRLAGFWIARHPVTNGEYRDFLEDTGREGRPSTWYLGAYPYDRGNHPVAGVGPEDADAYAAWLAERTGHPWRLPTEAEWEHAAKGTDGREFPWGDTFDARAANTREAGVHTTTPVGAFPAGRSPYGAYDMGGNVEEFVADAYAPYPGGPRVADHLVETMGEYRIARGGSFSRFGDLTRTRRRHGAFPGPLYPVGFRLATGERPRS